MHRRAARGLTPAGSLGLAMGGPVPVAAAKTTASKDLSVPGGIGAARAGFDPTDGAPTTDVFDDVSRKMHTDDATHDVPHSEGRSLDVLFVVNKDDKERGGDRAYDMIITAPAGRHRSPVDATIVAGFVLPNDAKATGDLAPVPNVATPSFDREEQTFTSPFVAKDIPDTHRCLNGQAGLITVSRQPGNPGGHTQLNVCTEVN